MAYTVPNRDIIRRWQKAGRKAYGIHSASGVVGVTIDRTTGLPFATGTWSDTIGTPPGRIIGVQYGIKTAPETYGNATSGALTVKAESTAGVQIFTDAALTSAQNVWLPVGTVAVDEARGVTAATDAFSGGFPIRGGIFSSVASGTDGERITVDYLVRYCTYAKLTLTSTSGADGAGTSTNVVRLGSPGVLAAVALDFQNMPATTDVAIWADAITTGTPLFTSTSSLTDLAPSLVGRPGGDEAAGATAATDGTECANGFKSDLVVHLAEADAFTSGNEKVIVELWIDE